MIKILNFLWFEKVCLFWRKSTKKCKCANLKLGAMGCCISGIFFYILYMILLYCFLVCCSFTISIPVINSWGQAGSMDLNVVGLSSLFQVLSRQISSFTANRFLTPSLRDRSWTSFSGYYVLHVLQNLCTKNKIKKQAPQNGSDIMMSFHL